MTKKNVLLIAKHSAKAEALVRFWPHDDWTLYLYTFRKKEWFPGMLEQLGSKWMTHISVSDSNSKDKRLVENRKKLLGFKRDYRQKTRGIRKYIHHKLLRLFDQQLIKWALPSISRFKNIARQVKPDLVLSIYEPLAANLIARRIANLQGVPWIAYFRDHCTTYNELYRLPFLWQLQSAYDIRLHATMRSLVGVSTQFVDILRNFYNIPESRSHVVTGGFNDSDLPFDIKARCITRRNGQFLPLDAQTQRSKQLLISYVGVLYGHRVEPLVVLMNAIQALADKGIPCKLQLILNKASDVLPTKVRKKIERARANGLITNFGTSRIPHGEALKMLDSADVNLILEGMSPPHSMAGTLTWKVFDLMMIARPAVAICAPTLPIGEYLREAGIGTDCKDTAGAVARIIDVWRWKQGGVPPSWYTPSHQIIDQYSYRGMAERMNAVLKQVYAESRQ